MKTDQTSEKTLEPALKKFVELDNKGWCIKLVALHISGLPDRICLIHPGIIFFVEVKTAGKKPRKIQLWVHNKIRSLGFNVFVLDNKEVLEEIKNKYGHI